MSFDNPVVVCLVGASIGLLLFFVARLYILTKRLNTSFAKLGYIVREDAKKYFDDASEKIVATNEQFHDMYEAIVQEGTKKALIESGVVMEQAILDAQKQANRVILTAQTDAQAIITGAKTEADNHMEQALRRTADTMSWVMTQYMKEQYTIDEHQALIEKLVRTYVDEHRK